MGGGVWRGAGGGGGGGTLWGCARWSFASFQAPSFASAALAYLPTGTESTLAMESRPPFRALARSAPLMASVVVFESLGAISTILLPKRLKRVSALIRFLPAR